MATLASKTMIYRGLGSGIIRVMKEGVKVEFVNEESANQFKSIIWRTAQKGGSTTQKSGKEFLKEDKEFRKEFLNAKEIIHSMILAKPETTTGDMTTKIGVSDRQVRKYIKKLIDLGFLKREGGRKHGHWIVTDKDC